MSPKITTAHGQGQRDRIIDAATRCFARHGFHEATIQDVCDEAGLSKGGLYTYFKSKEALLATLIQEGFGATLHQARDAAREGRDAVEKLNRIAEFLIGQKHQSAQLLLEIWAEASKNPVLAGVYAEQSGEWHRFLSGLLQEGIVEGVIKADVDPDALATVLLAVFGGIRLQEGVTRQQVDWRQVVRTLLRGLSEGIVVGR